MSHSLSISKPIENPIHFIYQRKIFFSELPKIKQAASWGIKDLQDRIIHWIPKINYKDSLTRLRDFSSKQDSLMMTLPPLTIKKFSINFSQISDELNCASLDWTQTGKNSSILTLVLVVVGIALMTLGIIKGSFLPFVALGVVAFGVAFYNYQRMNRVKKEVAEKLAIEEIKKRFSQLQEEIEPQMQSVNSVGELNDHFETAKKIVKKIIITVEKVKEQFGSYPFFNSENYKNLQMLIKSCTNKLEELEDLDSKTVKLTQQFQQDFSEDNLQFSSPADLAEASINEEKYQFIKQFTSLNEQGKVNVIFACMNHASREKELTTQSSKG